MFDQSPPAGRGRGCQSGRGRRPGQPMDAQAPRSQLAAALARVAAGDRAALRLSAEDRARLEAEGRKPHWRFKLEERAVEFVDLVRGAQSVDETSQSDPVLIRAITTDTGDREGQFDRDTLPSTGIARATGPDTLLYANGPLWRTQRKLAASPFGKTTLFQPEVFHEFAASFRETVRARLGVLRAHLQQSGKSSVQLPLEPEIKAVMLEMLANNFFGA